MTNCKNLQNVESSLLLIWKLYETNTRLAIKFSFHKNDTVICKTGFTDNNSLNFDFENLFAILCGNANFTHAQKRNQFSIIMKCSISLLVMVHLQPHKFQFNNFQNILMPWFCKSISTYVLNFIYIYVYIITSHSWLNALNR